MIVQATNCIAHLVLTLVAIPMVIKSKYIINSRALLTGWRNLTIERAPTRPRDNAKDDLITAIMIAVPIEISGKTLDSE